MSKAKRTSKATKKAVAKKVTKKTTKKVAKKAVSKKATKNTKTGKKTGKAEKKDYEVGKGKPPVDTMFVPGVSGNPKGRPKGKLNFDTRVDMAIDALCIKLADHHNKLPKNKNNQIKPEDIDVEGEIFMQLLNKARAGDSKMIDSFLDRRHGKATARIELTGKDGDPIAYEERKAAAKSRARAMLDKWTGKK